MGGSPITETAPEIAAALMGRWHVVASTLPLWKDGKKRNPAIIYDAMPGVSSFKDTVEYEAQGMFSKEFKPTSIVGVDNWLGPPESPLAFRWRGTGFLRLVSCDCRVVDHDAALTDWCVVLFGKTPFTPAGVDLYCRKPDMPAARVEELMATAYVREPSLKALVEAAGGVTLTLRG